MKKMEQDKRILLVANTASMIKLFNIRNINILQRLGFKVFVAANFTTPGTISQSENSKFKALLRSNEIRYFNVTFQRGIGNPIANYRVFNQLCQIIDDYGITAIHTHAPLSSIISRRVAKEKKIKCIYTSHGFQFFPGGPLKSWLLFYPLEWYYSHWTDALITINSDDYRTAQKMAASRVYYIPGVGSNVNKSLSLPESTRNQLRHDKRRELGVATNDFMILSVGELSKRKNHATVIKAIAKLKNPHIKYYVAGIGPEKEHLIALARELGIAEQVHLLGFQNKLRDLYLAADLNAFISLREGLGMGGLDGVALGLFILASADTGAKDYVDPQTGILIKKPLDIDEVSSAIKLVIDKGLKSHVDRDKIMRFDVSHIDNLMTKIYRRELCD